MYTCPRCGYENEQKKHFRQHLERKLPCAPKLSNTPPAEILLELLSSKTQNPYSCKKGCGKSFHHQSSRYRHERDCDHDKIDHDKDGDSSDLNESSVHMKRISIIGYNCPRCGFACEEKQHLVQHLQRKSPCIPYKSDVPIHLILKEIGQNNMYAKKDAEDRSRIRVVSADISPIALVERSRTLI